MIMGQYESYSDRGVWIKSHRPKIKKKKIKKSTTTMQDTVNRMKKIIPGEH